MRGVMDKPHAARHNQAMPIKAGFPKPYKTDKECQEQFIRGKELIRERLQGDSRQSGDSKKTAKSSSRKGSSRDNPITHSKNFISRSQHIVVNYLFALL